MRREPVYSFTEIPITVEHGAADTLLTKVS